MKYAFLGFFALVVLAVVGSFAVGIGFNNTSVAHEAGIKAQYDQNRNNYDNFVKKVQEVAQVPEMYTEDLKKVYDGAISARYGEDGSRAMLQFIKEHNPNFDGSMYKEIQQVIEAGRDGFAADQKMLLDKKRVYEVHLSQFPNSMLAGFMGFPRIDLAKYDIVTSARTEKAFETKQDEAIKLR